jgi:hypothetical protein
MMAQQCIDIEMEYREWRESPMWYCVKTVLHNDGRIESEIVADEQTKLAIAIQSLDKPMDGAYETTESVTYYTYCQGYREAEKQLALSRA